MPKQFSDDLVITKSGVKIHYHWQLAVGSENRPVVLLPGLGGSLPAWNLVRAHLTKAGWSTLALDLRGHGQSDRPPSQTAYRMDNYCQDLVEVFDQLHVSHPILVGHCLGGMVAMTLAARRLYPLKRLVLVATAAQLPGWGRRWLKKVSLIKLLNWSLKVMPDFWLKDQVNYDRFIGTRDYDWGRIFGDILHTSPRSYFWLLENLAAWQAADILPQINVPTLVIAGTDDQVTPPAMAQELVAKIPDSKLAILPATNHLPLLNSPELLANQIVDFLSDI